MGMIISSEKLKCVKKFRAVIVIFRGKSSNIKVGYNSYINIGLVRGSVVFNRIRDKKTGKDIESISTSRRSLVDLEFIQRSNYIMVGDKFLFRSVRVCGIGKVIELI